ncbi:MAG: bifunctional demethylmenaquinone methyltransferase/2-methoxy-6-polyprenyl-1,4-benzoquinol methylase UbiE [Bacteroidetes bacterium]|nr:bifunctional demethylmenaquinone methyltransferase/2-methoxy-6-polyprenyl-1,4-benzoquinol methylase UbiE [Bacteroidota bacterium]
MDQDKNKDRISEMFNSISDRYDFLNHFLSFGIDRYWRKKVIRLLEKKRPREILDVATGTGDLAIALAQLTPSGIIGIDIADKMLELAIEKVKKSRLDSVISFEIGDALRIPFPDNTFDAVTVAFGVRNFEDLTLGLTEMKRVLKPSGSMVILEFSQPGRLFGILYRVYSTFIIPIAGRMVSKHNFAYHYLPASVKSFPSGEKFLRILYNIGLTQCHMYPLTFGISTIYTGEKPV